MRANTMRLLGKHACASFQPAMRWTYAFCASCRKSSLRRASDAVLDTDPRYQGDRVGRKDILDYSDDEDMIGYDGPEKSSEDEGSVGDVDMEIKDDDGLD